MSYNTIDLHGYDRYSANAEARIFLNRHHEIKTKEVTIVHGVGEKILQKSLHNILKNISYIEDYKLNSNNLGETIIKLKIKA